MILHNFFLLIIISITEKITEKLDGPAKKCLYAFCYDYKFLA